MDFWIGRETDWVGLKEGWIVKEKFVKPVLDVYFLPTLRVKP